MRINELVTEGIFDIDPKLEPFVKMGRKITAGLEKDSGVDWQDDEQWNKAAALGRELTSLGSEFGTSSAAEAVKKAGLSTDEAKEIFAMVRDVDPSAFAPEDPEDEDGSEEELD
mgnify:CR=1 FL=1